MCADAPRTLRLLSETLGDLCASARALVLTDVVFKALAFTVLTPLVSVLFRALLAFSGDEVLSDVDIALSFLRPLGWVCLIGVGGLWLAIVAVELAALMVVIDGSRRGRRIGFTTAIWVAFRNLWPVLQVTARIVVWTALISAPFLAAAGVVYRWLLARYDINYYLSSRPPEFLLAVAIGGVLSCLWGAALLRCHSSWFFALPLVVFEKVRPAEALRLSSHRTQGVRRRIVFWIVGWSLAMTGCSLAVSGGVAGLARMLNPGAAASLDLLALTIGIALILWALLTLAVNLASTISFAAILLVLYRHHGSLAERSAGNAGREASQPLVPDDLNGLGLSSFRVLSVALVGTLVAALAGVLFLQGLPVDDRVEVMAHRGASATAPENTLAAIEQAITAGADWVEIDVQETADGEVVVIHDSDFMKLAANDLKIWEATRDDLAQIDVGSWFAPEFKDQRVPTLGEVLDLCRDRAGVNIELKYYGHDQKLEERVVEIVESRGMEAQVMAMSLKRDAVSKLRKLRPKWRVGLLLSLTVGDVRKLDVDFLAVNARFASRRLIRTAHRQGKQVYVWTVNDAPTMSTLIGRGIDGVLTDKPALARDVLAQRREMSPVERLLLELAGVLGIRPQLGAP